MIALALVILLLPLPIADVNSSQQQKAFRPYGYYFIQGKVPKSFQNIDTIQNWLSQIKIYDATTATVTSELYETLKLQQGSLQASSSEVLDVTLRDGKLVITSSETRARIY